jgi:hypothetical protein
MVNDIVKPSLFDVRNVALDGIDVGKFRKKLEAK